MNYAESDDIYESRYQKSFSVLIVLSFSIDNPISTKSSQLTNSPKGIMV